MRLRLSKYALWLSTIILTMVLLQACTRSAPPLPDVNTETKTETVTDAASPVVTAYTAPPSLVCEELDYKLSVLEAEESTYTDEIEGDRIINQVAGFLGGLFIWPLIALDDNTAEKLRLDEFQVARDGVYAEKKQLGCP